MKLLTNSRLRSQAGYSALFITLILVAASVLLLGSTLTRTTSASRLNDRNVLYLSADGAAEAAVEKVISRMMVDFANYGEGQVQANLSLYRTGLLPTNYEGTSSNNWSNTYWNNYVFSDGTGNTNAVYVFRTTTNANAPFVALAEQYQGLSGYASTYRIMANARPISSTYNYNFTNAVQQDMQLAQIPIFQFAIFYNGLLEFSDTATFTINGPVHANSNIYVGSPANLTFNGIVTTTGNITAPANAGYGTGSWTGSTTYNGSPSPGYLTGQPSLNLPIGTSSTAGTNVIQILYPSNNTQNAAMVSQLYATKAHMVVQIFTNNGGIFTATFKTGSNDPAPYTFTNSLTMLTSNAWTLNRAINTNVTYGTNWGWNWDWLSTTNTFYDQRQQAWMTLAQIDVNKFTNWMATWLVASNNTNVNGKFSLANPLNIVYIADWRNTNSAASTLSAVRLWKGTNLPSTGLTVATPNPLYIWGNYNAPNLAYTNSTNVTLAVPASVACDALTILSPAWTDASSTNAMSVNATSDTINCAILTGIDPSTGTGSATYSGGCNNLPRLLEDWTGDTLTLNTSIVCLYASQWATRQFVLPGTYYKPPTRNFSFNLNYTSSAGMPPGTPNICRGIRAAWCNPTPGDTNFTYSFANDFVPN